MKRQRATIRESGRGRQAERGRTRQRAGISAPRPTPPVADPRIGNTPGPAGPLRPAPLWPESTRCTACRKRRHWLLNHALNPVEVALSALLDGGEADEAAHDDGAHDDCSQTVPPARQPVRTRRSLPAPIVPKTQPPGRSLLYESSVS